MSLRAASSLGKCPFVLIALRSCRFNASIAFVVYTTRRSSGGKARNGVTYSQAFSQACVDHREARSPRVVEGLERRLGGVGIDGGVDRLQVASDLLPLPPRHVLEAMPDQVYHTRLHDRVREDRLDRLREALQPVDAAEQDVGDAALLELAQHLHPELRALRLLEPHPEHVPLTLERDAEREVAGASLHAAAL